jgi:hypothetical protein
MRSKGIGVVDWGDPVGLAGMVHIMILPHGTQQQ